MFFSIKTSNGAALQHLLRVGKKYAVVTGREQHQQLRNLHPEKRLEIARKKASERVMAQIAADQHMSQSTVSGSYYYKEKKGRGQKQKIPISDAQAAKLRLELAKEKVLQNIQTFKPVVGEEQKVVSMDNLKNTIISLLNDPSRKRNDGTSSGALAEDRLRQKTKEALARIMISTTTTTSIPCNSILK